MPCSNIGSDGKCSRGCGLEYGACPLEKSYTLQPTYQAQRRKWSDAWFESNVRWQQEHPPIAAVVWQAEEPEPDPVLEEAVEELATQPEVVTSYTLVSGVEALKAVFVEGTHDNAEAGIRGHRDGARPDTSERAGPADTGAGCVRGDVREDVRAVPEDGAGETPDGSVGGEAGSADGQLANQEDT